ncbi:MAG: FG-GAP-like repeat-containing protein [Acetobacteraceae bacterium]|nr:FG-GAP-like repeat-containing protein [Acetobacteraceae bacterium]
MSTSAYSFAGLNGANGFELWGPWSNSRNGSSVAVVGDVNGDGLVDLLSGGPLYSDGVNQYGSASLIRGRTAWSSFPNAYTEAQNGNGTYYRGVANGDSFGLSVAAAGDVNGDGYDDIIIGSPGFDGAGADAGGSYVIFGGPNVFTTNLTGAQTLNGTTGFRIQGPAGLGNGYSVSSAGDVNGDGFSDLIVGTSQSAGSGLSYVVFGKASGWGSTFDVTTLNGTNGFALNGFNNAGAVVADAGDVNGDGHADVMVGLNSLGAVFVVFGRAGGWTPSIDLSALDGTDGFRIDGVAYGALDAAGDVNGDGFGDLILGNMDATPNGARSGSAYVVFGHAGAWTPTMSVSSLDGVNGFRLDGATAGERAGSSVAGAGDVNGDGFADLIVGASRANYTGGTVDAFGNPLAVGAVYVVYGRSGAWDPTVNLGALDAQGYRIDGVEGSALTGGVGYSVAGGDIDNDGFADVLTGAPYDGGWGSAFAYFSLAGGPATYRGTTLADTLRGSALGDRMDGHGQNDRLFGNAGNDTIDGGAGNDAMDGGTGSDTASYASATALVRVSLALATAQNTAGAGTDTLSNVENLLGSAFNDTLTGSAAANTLTGGLGDDLLSGGGGNDALLGDAGRDTAAFSGNRSAYTLTKNAGAGWSVTGTDGTDTVTGVERLQFADQTVSIGFARTEDMAGRGYGDILFQSTLGGWLYRWQLEGTNRLAEGSLGGPGANWVVAGKGDLNGDLNADILWQNTSTGQLYVWLMNGGAKLGEGSVGMLAAGQGVGGVGDTDGDGKADIVLRGSDGSWAVQRMNGTTTLSTAGGTLDTAWSVAAVSDFNGDLRADVLWRNTATGQLYLWQMNGSTVSAQGSYATPGASWNVFGAADLNTDGRADVLLRNGSGWLWGCLTDATTVAAGSNRWLGAEGGGYTLRKIADYTGDDRADLLFYEATNGYAFLQSMNGLNVLAQQGAGQAGAGFAIL